jgi:hypothetical protein
MSSPPPSLTASGTSTTPPPEPDHARLVLRTREIALRAGRVPPCVMQADYEQARRELCPVVGVRRTD